MGKDQHRLFPGSERVDSNDEYRAQRKQEYPGDMAEHQGDPLLLHAIGQNLDREMMDGKQGLVAGNTTGPPLTDSDSR